MNSHIKNSIGVVAILVAAVFAYAAWLYADAFSRSIEPSSFRSFSVSAEGEVVAIPDVAQFSFSVITQGGTDIAKLQGENVRSMNRAIDFVKAQGVEDKDVKTQDFSLEPRYEHFSCPRNVSGSVEACPPPEITGYTVTQTVEVKIRDFAKVGAIVAGVVDEGANSVSRLFFTIDDRDAPEIEARASAIEKAREKAEAVARAGGFQVGRLLSIQESGSPVYPVHERSFDQGFGGGVPVAVPAPSIEPGSQEVPIRVTLVYEIL